MNQTADVVRIGVVAGPHSGVGERHRLEPNLFAKCESSVKLNLEITLILKYHHIHMAHVHVFYSDILWFSCHVQHLKSSSTSTKQTPDHVSSRSSLLSFPPRSFTLTTPPTSEEAGHVRRKKGKATWSSSTYSTVRQQQRQQQQQQESNAIVMFQCQVYTCKYVFSVNISSVSLYFRSLLIAL